MNLTTVLTDADVRLVVSRLPGDVKELLERGTFPLFLGGGFIRAVIAGEKINDVDLFGADSDRLRELAEELKHERGGRLHVTDNAFTVLSPPRAPVQFIHRWRYTEAEELCVSFDFTVAQAVVYNNRLDGSWLSVCSPRYYSDLAARRLYYTAPKRIENVGGSLIRMRRFLRQGYTIQVESLARVCARLLTGLEREKVSDLSDEAHTTRLLLGLLREVDPAVVVDGMELIEDDHGDAV